MIRLEAWGERSVSSEKLRGVCDSFKSQDVPRRLSAVKKWREKRTVTKEKERTIERRYNKEEKETRKEAEKGKSVMTQDNAKL